MRMALKDIPEEIIEQYHLRTMASDSWVYMQIEKGMPGLKQAGKIANDRLKSTWLNTVIYPSPVHPHFGNTLLNPSSSRSQLTTLP